MTNEEEAGVAKPTLSALRLSVCAVGYFLQLPDVSKSGGGDPSYQILGTGFMIAQTTVLTNRHVIQALKESGAPREHWFLMFTYPDLPDAVRTSYRPCQTIGSLEGPVADMGLIEFSRDTDPGFSLCNPPPFGDGFSIGVGTSVAVCGYPHGGTLLNMSHIGIRRFGPVVHRGVVSAISPFDLPQRMEAFLTDILGGGGMSGSPIFRPKTNEVVGIHFAGNESKVGLALPLNDHRRRVLLAAHLKAKEESARHGEHLIYEVKITPVELQ